jgi:hypothetical protein
MSKYIIIIATRIFYIINHDFKLDNHFNKYYSTFMRGECSQIFPLNFRKEFEVVCEEVIMSIIDIISIDNTITCLPVIYPQVINLFISSYLHKPPFLFCTDTPYRYVQVSIKLLCHSLIYRVNFHMCT